MPVTVPLASLCTCGGGGQVRRGVQTCKHRAPAGGGSAGLPQVPPAQRRFAPQPCQLNAPLNQQLLSRGSQPGGGHLAHDGIAPAHERHLLPLRQCLQGQRRKGGRGQKGRAGLLKCTRQGCTKCARRGCGSAACCLSRRCSTPLQGARLLASAKPPLNNKRQQVAREAWPAAHLRVRLVEPQAAAALLHLGADRGVLGVPRHLHALGCRRAVAERDGHPAGGENCRRHECTATGTGPAQPAGGQALGCTEQASTAAAPRRRRASRP